MNIAIYNSLKCLIETVLGVLIMATFKADDLLVIFNLSDGK